MREVEIQKDYLRGAYRDPDQAADALDKLIERSGRDLRAAALTLREEGPEVLGILRGQEGWLAGRAAQDDRTRAKSAAATIGGSLDREATARDAAVRHHTGEVEQKRARDAVEVPGLSKAALDTLKAVQMAGLPGVGREHQAGLGELAHSFVQGHDGMRLVQLGTSGLNGRRRRPNGNGGEPRSGSAGNCRQSRSRTVSGSGRSAG